ncbi:MAG: hypothetical protein GF411_04100 [Candidatus Lokiarchaeota archaeon]|nr:hypothetical protein [Candidatus Lokiarchaeota archaeon]
MQEIAVLLREISIGVLIAGLFYTFGMYLLGQLFAAFGEHETDHDMDHSTEVGHDYDHEVGHDIDHEYDMDHDLDISHEYEVDHGVDVGHEVEVDHDLDMDHDIELDHVLDVDHDVGLDHDVDMDHDLDAGHDYDIDHDSDYDTDHGHDIEHDAHLDMTDHDGFFEAERGPPLGVTIGSTLVSFGFIGSVIYYDGILVPIFGKVGIHILGVIAVVGFIRYTLSKLFVERGFYIENRHLVGREVEAVSTISDDFGEIRTETAMGLRRFNARPFQKGVVFEKGMKLYIVSADERFVYVDPRPESIHWTQEQTRKEPEE